jgi:hypothetical protein
MRRDMRALTTPLTVAAALALDAGHAAACPSCYGSAASKVLDTYYLSTVMLSLLPFAVVAAIAGLGWLLARTLSAPADPQDGGGPPLRPPGLRNRAASSEDRGRRPAVALRPRGRAYSSRRQAPKIA